MARLHTAGGEIRDHNTVAAEASPDGRSAGTAACTTETTVYRSGSASIKCPGTSTLTAFREFAVVPSAGTGIWTRTYLYFDALPSATKKISRIGTAQVSARLTSAGKLQLFNDAAGTQIGSDSTMTLAVNTWYRVELYGVVGTGATDGAELRVTQDEDTSETVATTSAVSITDTQPTTVSMGWIDAPGVSSNMYLDDLAVNDSTGAKQNSWPGYGKVFMSPPDREVAIGWSHCSTAGFHYDGFNFFPSQGHAAATGHTTSHQILSSSSSGTQADQFSCRSYAKSGAAGNYLVGFDNTATALIASSGTRVRVATEIHFNGTIDAVTFHGYVLAGTPQADFWYLVAEIQTDAGGPSGTVLGSGQIDYWDLPVGSANATWITVPLTTQVPLEPGQKYWLVFRRHDDSFSAFTHVGCHISNRVTYGDAERYNHNGSVWSLSAVTDPFTIRLFSVGGIAPIKVWNLHVCDGEAIATGTKTISIEGTGDPVVAPVTFTVGENAGACGVYPTNWRWHKITAYDVTPANSSTATIPKIKVVKTDTTTREVEVCAFHVQIEVGPSPDPG